MKDPRAVKDELDAIGAMVRFAQGELTSIDRAIVDNKRHLQPRLDPQRVYDDAVNKLKREVGYTPSALKPAAHTPVPPIHKSEIPKLDLIPIDGRHPLGLDEPEVSPASSPAPVVRLGLEPSPGVENAKPQQLSLPFKDESSLEAEFRLIREELSKIRRELAVIRSIAEDVKESFEFPIEDVQHLFGTEPEDEHTTQIDESDEL